MVQVHVWDVLKLGAGGGGTKYSGDACRYGVGTAAVHGKDSQAGGEPLKWDVNVLYIR
jgi:hypothetical protein